MGWVLVTLMGCSDPEPGGGGAGGSAGAAAASGHSIYADPGDLSQLSGDTFFDHPWPSDQRLEGGAVRFEGYPNPRSVPLIADFTDSMRGELDGFSPVASGFLRFDVALSPASLPESPLAARERTSALQLIDVDERSPERGQRRPVSWHFRRDAGVYWPSNTLAVMPTFGFPLRPATRYALVVTSAVRAEDGGRLEPAPTLRAQLEAGAAGPLGTALEALAQAGLAPDSIVHLAVFITNDPTAKARKLARWVRDHQPAPTALTDAWAYSESVPGVMDVYVGRYGPSPNFQRGSIPFKSYGDGGELAFKQDGEPDKQGDFDLRFALAVPSADRCPMPADGYPIVLYAHGTGGSYRSMLGAGDEAEALAARCIATMGIDQIFHGDRPGGQCGQAAPPCNTNVELIFFNVQNPTAARANGPASAIDVVQQARLFTESHLTVPAAVSRTGAELRFDGERLGFFGHSQGGLNGPMFLAVDDQARGGVLSGSGSMISITLLEKSKPVNIAGLLKTLIGVSNADEQASEDINSFHPAISLAQSIVDETDPIHYVPFILRHPLEGFAPKSVLMTEGVNPDFSGDNYTPPHAIEVQSVALGLPPLTPIIHPIEELRWSELEPLSVPPAGISGNLAGGAATGALVQWPASQASDGHFVIYDIPAAMDQCSGFVAGFMDNTAGHLPPR